MKNASKITHAYSSQPDSYYNKSYTYSHYYQNKPIHSHNKNLFNSPNTLSINNPYPTSKYPPNHKFENATSKQIQNFHTPYIASNSNNIITSPNQDLKYKKNISIENNNSIHSNSNNCLNSCVTNSNLQTKATLNKDSLLFTDVYGKENESKHSQDSCNNQNNTNSSIEFSNLLRMFSSKNSDSSNKSESQGFDGNFNISEMLDIETILKLKKFMERLQEKNTYNEPITNLLYAIKPFIQESKKTIIDQIVKFVAISSILKDFNNLL